MSKSKNLKPKPSELMSFASNWGTHEDNPHPGPGSFPSKTVLRRHFYNPMPLVATLVADGLLETRKVKLRAGVWYDVYIPAGEGITSFEASNRARLEAELEAVIRAEMAEKKLKDELSKGIRARLAAEELDSE